MTPVQYATLLVVIAVLVVEAMWMQRNPTKWYYAASITFLALHAFVFYAVLMIDADIIDLNANGTLPLFTYWSSVLRLHSFITILSLEAARLPLSKLTAALPISTQKLYEPLRKIVKAILRDKDDEN